MTERKTAQERAQEILDKVSQCDEPREPLYDLATAVEREMKNAPPITQADIDFMNKLFAGHDRRKLSD